MTAHGTAGPLRIATRGSRLARWQAEWIAHRLGVPVEFVVVETTGDVRVDTPIHTIGGTGVFVKEVQHAVLDGRADLAVHSAKDLPAAPTPGLAIAAVPPRADARDALVGSTLAAVPSGGVVATGAVRRRAQLAAARPDIEFAELRGNIDTRLRKAQEFSAIVVALAALERLGLRDRVAEALAPEVVLPQVGQGALAVECRADDTSTHAALRTLDDAGTHACLTAERTFLADLGGGCELPCGAYARPVSGGFVIDALLAGLDGTVVARAHAEGHDPVELGHTVARLLLEEVRPA